MRTGDERDRFMDMIVVPWSRVELAQTAPAGSFTRKPLTGYRDDSGE